MLEILRATDGALGRRKGESPERLFQRCFLVGFKDHLGGRLCLGTAGGGCCSLRSKCQRYRYCFFSVQKYACFGLRDCLAVISTKAKEECLNTLV